MKIRISTSINVSKINKDRLFSGKKGKYLDATIIIDTEEVNQYGDNGFIAENISKEEREAGDKGTILGNAKIVWRDDEQQQEYQKPQGQPQPMIDINDEDIPF